MTDKIPTTKAGIGMWNEKIIYFPPDGPPSMAGEEIASEFYVEFHRLPDLFEELYENRDKFADMVLFSEFRPLEQDDIPLSPGKDQQVYSFHTTWKKDFHGVYYAVWEL